MEAPSPEPVSPFAMGLILAAFTITPVIITIGVTANRYQEFRSGYGWDLAYYNQWYWSLLHGDHILSVRPLAAYAVEGPSIWRTNYLSPLRYLLVPIYALWPGPRTLLAIQASLFWMVVPAAYELVRGESGSRLLGLTAAALVPFTPILWLLALNDFRELQVAIPFVIVMISGWRGRRTGLAALGIIGVLACRQEFALMVASLAIVPAREPEDIERSYQWAWWGVVIGLGWFFVGFFGYLTLVAGSLGPSKFMAQFAGPRPGMGEGALTALRIVVWGLGFWALWATASVRVAILAVPWLASACSGRWTMDWVETESWHHVRYVAPAIAPLLAAALIGFARLGRRSPRIPLLLAVLTVVGAFPTGSHLIARFQRIPRVVAPEDVEPTWTWIRRVPADDAVLAAYELTAPLSSRRHLYSYVLDANLPPTTPEVQTRLRWLFLVQNRFPREAYLDRGYRIVHDGPSIRILHRP